mgnify:CR=1 FL=1
MIDPSLDYTGKTVCIIGGASGIGNASAQALRAQGAEVHVAGTRGSEADYDADEGSDLDGLTYHQLDAGDDAAIIALRQKFTRLDILVCSQGMVMYKRAEFAKEIGSPIIMSDYLTMGWAAQASLSRWCRDKGMLLHVHRAMPGVIDRHPKHGINFRCLQWNGCWIEPDITIAMTLNQGPGIAGIGLQMQQP